MFFFLIATERRKRVLNSHFFFVGISYDKETKWNIRNPKTHSSYKSSSCISA